MAYVPATFSCPHCQAPLRVRQRPAGTLHLPCPDCGRPLELSEHVGELLVRPAGEGAAPLKKAPSRPVRSAAVAGTGGRLAKMKPAVATSLQNPLVVTWLAAGAAAVVLGVAFVRSGADRKPAAVAAVAPAGQPAENAPSEPAAVSPPAEPLAEEAAVSEAPPAEVVPAPVAVDRPPPVVAPKPAASPPVDPREAIAARLAQRVLRFEQPTPVAFDTLRLQIEDLAGVPIRYDDAVASDAGLRKAEVRLSLADVTLAAVLDEAARQAGLAHVIDPDAVRLVPAGERVSAREVPTAGLP